MANNRIDMNEESNTSFDQTQQQSSEKDTSSRFQDFIFSPVQRNSSEGPWAVHILDGPNNGAQTYLASGKKYVVGRDLASCDIVLLDPLASKQHLRISITEDHSAYIEDLNSTNGTTENKRPLKEKKRIEASVIVHLGMSSLLIINTEAQQKTVVYASETELLNLLQKSKNRKEKHSGKKHFSMRKIFIGILIGTVLVILSLVPSREVKIAQAPIDLKSLETLVPKNSIQYIFHEDLRQLFLSGNVQTTLERDKLVTSLQDLAFINTIDTRQLVIDELLCKEFNTVLIPQWPRIILTCPDSGKYVVSGTIETKISYDKLNLYLNLNFPFLGNLTNAVIVEEMIADQLMEELQKVAPDRLTAEFIDEELVLAGTLLPSQEEEVERVVDSFRERMRIRTVLRGIVVADGEEENEVLQSKAGLSALAEDISSRFTVSGYVKKGNTYRVIINGKLYKAGETLNGMNITTIQKSVVLLEANERFFKIAFFAK